jgi:hypothetical protein
LLEWLTANPPPPDAGEPVEEASGMVTAAVVLAEHVTVDDRGPWLHHITGSLDGAGLASWREEGMLRSALRDVIARSREDADP